ncbi:hypothetical protein E1176_01255 [Fulvivirga sp. RKSG066]|nr:hypothetical protein [Fulvivirga aurantia]
MSDLEELIKATEETLKSYEALNMSFAYDLYNEEMNEIMEETGCMEAYAENFKQAHRSLSKKLKHLKKSRHEVQFQMIMDTINQPPN